MARGPVAFKKRDVTAAVKAVVAAGCEVRGVEVSRDGRIVVLTGKPADPPTAGEGAGANPWDAI